MYTCAIVCTGGALRSNPCSVLAVWMMTVMTASDVAGLKMYQSLNKILSKGLDTCALPQRDWIARGLQDWIRRRGKNNRQTMKEGEFLTPAQREKTKTKRKAAA